MSNAVSRIVLVTGGTKGIGRAVASHFAQCGARVFVAARHPPGLPLTEGEVFLSCDVGEDGQPAALLREVAERAGRLDVLVNAAGLAGAALLGSTEEETLWHRVLSVNLTGSWACSRAAIPLFPADGGRIINIASVLGLRAVPDQPAYCAAKHGVIGLTRSMALALAPKGVTVNAICPGWVQTDMALQRWRELDMDAASAAAGAPTGRISTPQEIAAMVAYFASDAARNVTGQAVVMDGGESL
jgi:NAD(P)-dependent dehydrogenase (short-subunit alcohol dehydrogenase family)